MPPTELTIFPSFPLLPTEIRIMIWKLAIQAIPGRDILLRYTPTPALPSGLLVLPKDVRTEITSCTTIPAVLHACPLSRLLSLERWTLCMAGHAAAEKKVYIDATSDSLYFPDQKLLVIWHLVGDWADVVRFVDANNLYVVGKGDSVLVGLSYHSSLLTLSFIIDRYSTTYHRRTIT